MTDSFEHPDGNHYRCIGSQEEGYNVGNYVVDWSNGSMVKITDENIKTISPIFERVESPLWPWTGPSGRHYNIGDNGLHWNMQASILPEDFAGLAERLAKQATLNEGDA